MKRRTLAAFAAGAALLVAAVLALRTGVQPQPAVIAPDGQRIVAYHDAALVTPPVDTGDRPQPPGPLHTDPRRGGVVVSWPPAPYGFEVRWGRAGTPLDGVRYVAGPAVGLTGLPAGRHRIEVRAVDQFGHRSEPSSTEADVSDDPPPWQRGYGYLEDLTDSGGLPPDRWKLSERERQCPARVGAGRPLVLGACRVPQLRPISPLALGDPGADGVRGRLVVLADTPAPPWVTSVASPRGWSNNLVIAVRPPPAADDPAAGVTLTVSAGRVSVTIRTRDGAAPAEHVVDDTASGSPGALRRWELIFGTDSVDVRRDGRPLGTVGYRPSWNQATVEISGLALGNTEDPPGPRVALVGLTGPTPDGRPAELVELEASQSDKPSGEHQFAIPPAGTAVAARVTGEIAAAAGPRATLPSAADVVVAAGGRELAAQRLPIRLIDRAGYRFTADIPVEALRADPRLTLRSATGADFWAYDLVLELTHAPGTQLSVTQPRLQDAYPLRPARPTLLVRRDGRTLDRGARIERGKLDVEVYPDSLIAQAYAETLAGWVALRAELNGRRILDQPTAADAAAVAGNYRFTLDAGPLPDGDAVLTVSLVPDRPGIAAPSDRFTLQVGN